MSHISSQLHGREKLLDDLSKLKVLTSDFGRLEDSQKDYILDLTRKLVGIHCGGERGDVVVQKTVSSFQI